MEITAFSNKWISWAKCMCYYMNITLLMRSDQGLENIFKGYNIITEWIELDGTSGHPVQFSLLKVSQLEKVAQDNIHLGLQRWTLYSTPFCSSVWPPHCKTFLLMFNILWESKPYYGLNRILHTLLPPPCKFIILWFYNLISGVHQPSSMRASKGQYPHAVNLDIFKLSMNCIVFA